MAQVYLAEQTSLKRNVAIKVMRSDFGSDDTHRNGLSMKPAQRLDSTIPTSCRYSRSVKRRTFSTLRRSMSGEPTCGSTCRRRSRPMDKISLHLMKQVSSALHVAHQAGIGHRDIKPENIMGPTVGCEVTDFGLAQLTLGGERVNLTQMGVTMGTPLYMSPEQVNGASVDARSDLYSMGVTFYHLLSGNRPFRAALHLRSPTNISMRMRRL